MSDTTKNILIVCFGVAAVFMLAMQLWNAIGPIRRVSRRERHLADNPIFARIAQLDQRTALPDQCLHSAEADVRPQGGSPGLIVSRRRASVML
jgi:hypothetical protein